MLQKSPVLTPSLENLSYILRHREWWPDGFKWDFRYCSECALGMSRLLWGVDPDTLDDSRLRPSPITWELNPSYQEIFCTPAGKASLWLRLWDYDRAMKSVTPEQVADQLDKYLAKHV